MKTQFKLAALSLLLTTLNSQLSTALAQGSLTPPGAPAPTMKTLAQIEPRTPISVAPFTISVPGSYYLTTNLTVSGGDAITIATNGVTLDLSGFTISSTDPSATGYGILISGSLRNLTILNGFIQGGVTNNGSGVLSGNGFAFGINGYPQNARVSGVSVSGCLSSGIVLGNGDATVVESCTVRTVGSDGIVASTIKSSVAKDCGGTAIAGDQVTDCRGESINGYGLSATTAQNCYGYGGYRGLTATTAVNCYGYSTSISINSYGLFATTAQNCYGINGGGGNGTGLSASSAQNCYGYSYGSGYGIHASSTAQNCYGNSPSGTGVWGFLVNNCYGESASGYGIYAYDIATGSYGRTATGPAGLRAWIANSSDGNTMDVGNKFNMP